MLEAIRLALPFCIAYAAWRFSMKWPRAMRWCTVASALMTLLGLGVLIGTGSLRAPGSHTAAVHRWLAHGLLIFLWLAAPGAIGVILNQAVRLRPLRAVLGVVCCLLAVFLTLVASFTGYLPLPASEVLSEHESGGGVDLSKRFRAEETHNRFVVLHYFLLPALCVIVTLGWFLVAVLPDPTNNLPTVAQDIRRRPAPLQEASHDRA